MGAADAVPGVSGGTIALITGIYERLITAVNGLDPRVVGHAPQLFSADGRSACAAELREMDLPFLVVLGCGMGTAVVVLAQLVQVALSAFRGPTFAFFVGLIGASAFVLFDRRWLTEPDSIVAALAGFSIAFLIAGASGQGGLASSRPVVFVAGLFAISGMILPGISGAFILLLLGQYEYMTGVLTAFVNGMIALPTQGVSEQLLQSGTIVGIFLIGAVLGLLTVAAAVRWALDRHRSATLAFLVSLMLGSLRLPITEAATTTDLWSSAVTPLLGAIICGVVLVVALDYGTKDIEPTDGVTG